MFKHSVPLAQVLKCTNLLLKLRQLESKYCILTSYLQTFLQCLQNNNNSNNFEIPRPWGKKNKH